MLKDTYSTLCECLLSIFYEAMITALETKKLDDVFRMLSNGCCPTDDTLLEKLLSWLEASLDDAGATFT